MIVVVVAALFTTCPPASVPVLAAKLATPWYSAVTTWVATVGAVAGDVATPLPFRATWAPRFVPSTLNWTFPVAVPLPGATAVTVAVNVTFCPNTDGVPDVATAVVVAAALTT